MFSAALINDPFGDPGVYVEFKYKREAFLFDLGDISLLSPRNILKIRYVFVSHTHMDHFIGFDHLLRICLGRNQFISLFGPPGFLEKVESKLRAYTWNLVENYTNDFELTVTEIHPNHRVTKHYRCRNAFRPEGEETQAKADSILIERDSFIVRGVLLDHSIPSLAFRFEEKTRLNIKKNILRAMALPTGAWLTALKKQIMDGAPGETPVRIWWKDENGVIAEKFLPLGILKDQVVKFTSGQKVCYITDVLYSNENITMILPLARDAELLFIEAPFLHEDVAIARRKYHLTARQAGAIAAMAGVKRLSLFHFSPKYKGQGESLGREAMNSFEDKKHLDNGGHIL
ncbi:MAG: MBL fold metallo-hydrolase [Syntrophales bacterium LBB04]|nr:MBL fold metallo-hydrolase [Syntrophales bacterium LBB04]